MCVRPLIKPSENKNCLPERVHAYFHLFQNAYSQLLGASEDASFVHLHDRSVCCDALMMIMNTFIRYQSFPQANQVG